MKIATTEVIKEILPHPNADKLVIAKVLGYTAVVPKDVYKSGQVIIYVQPDSVLPMEDKWAEEYRKYAPKRIKAIKLRNVWSEGLVLPLDVLTNYDDGRVVEILDGKIGEDVSEFLHIKHYEPPVPQDLSAKGGLPYGIPKTDEERWENIEDIPYGKLVDLTLKIDGQSWSAFYHVDESRFGVCGRSFEYKLDRENNYLANAKNYNIEEKLTKFCKENNVSLCLRGESHGIGIQGFEINTHSKKPLSLAIFSVYLIAERRYARKGDTFYFINVAKALDLPHVPVVEENVELTRQLIDKYSIGIESLNGVPFEGVVVNHDSGSFKIINKYYDSNK